MRTTLLILTLFACAGVLLADAPPQAPDVEDLPKRPWLSPIDFPTGMERFEPTRLTQAIYQQGPDRFHLEDIVQQVAIKKIASKWHQSGGMEGVSGWKSDKFRLLPSQPRNFVGTIKVKTSSGGFQNNRGLRREYPDGTRFDDVLVNEKSSKVFEHRSREKQGGKWESAVLFRDMDERPAGYTGLRQSCSSCHNAAGTGSYGASGRRIIGLAPGSDTVISEELPWHLLRR